MWHAPEVSWSRYAGEPPAGVARGDTALGARTRQLRGGCEAPRYTPGKWAVERVGVALAT